VCTLPARVAHQHRLEVGAEARIDMVRGRKPCDTNNLKGVEGEGGVHISISIPSDFSKQNALLYLFAGVLVSKLTLTSG